METTDPMLAAIVAMGAAAAAQDPAPDLQIRLEQAVDRPTAEQRREAWVAHFLGTTLPGRGTTS